MSHRSLPFFSSSRAAAAAVFALLAGLSSAPLGAQRTDAGRSELERLHRAKTRELYLQPAWPRSSAHAGLANALALAGFEANPIQFDAGLLTRSYRRAGVAGAPDSFVLETCVADSAADAQERLIDWLSGLESARLAPRASELGLVLGDAAFVGRAGAAPSALAWVAFVRGNVAVRVSASDATREPGLDLGSIAAAVDAAIRGAPELQSAGAPAKPVIQTLAAARTTLVAGALLPLDVAVADPAQGEAHLEWIVGGPGQGYVERAKDGRWTLHTTGPGALTLILEATGSTGTWSRSELALSVMHE